jgi:glucan phosphorylase
MNHKEECDWFSVQQSKAQFQRFREHPIAYFCAEYALEQTIPTYAGGLGILAGDVVREAADQKLPFVAVGLYYHEGHVCDPEKAIKACVRTTPENVGLTRVVNKKGEHLSISVPIQDHDVVVQAWEFRQGENSVYMLDTDVEENTETDRRITDRLYVEDKEIRLKQEIILGIGGLRLLKALNIHPSVYHLNEGHSAMLMFELIRHEMEERKLNFDEAKQFAKRRVVFTNHTLMTAGYEVYSNDLVSLLLSKYAQQIRIPISELIKLGLVQESSMFSMTMLLLHTAGIISAVSKLHAKKALEIWPDHPMVGITNSVHTKTWNKIETDVSEPGTFWPRHQERKIELLAYMKDKLGVEWGKDELLIGWARRFVTYKRPLAALDDVERFKKIAQNANKPVRLVIGGIPHLNNIEGLAILEKLKSLIEKKLSGSVVYMPEYSMDVAKILTSGCDVWLNTPIVGFEACGTSGMKAAMNGVLPFSTKDGWIDEIELSRVGWHIDNDNVTESILDLLEHDITPMYYDRDSSGVPKLWEERMRNAQTMVMDRFCTTRMLREYVEMLYL